jgi:hypothetical protein
MAEYESPGDVVGSASARPNCTRRSIPQITPELIDVYVRRAHQLRAEALERFFGRIAAAARGTAQLRRQRAWRHE